MTATQKLKQQIAMQDVEIAALKLELLTKNERIELQDEAIKKMADELDVSLKVLLFESKQKQNAEESAQLVRDYFDKANVVSKENIRQLQSKLDKIPNWIKWLFI